ncbi:hypothetical protein D7Z54_08670 [Salibacterium salarium]|uniref:Uncharacterized protein n=1 Tax=Salibacterium salarium TaxID=284579 RepID=A0A3R9PA16_9BACI|nr:hypothetical protein [Salibacterium salarium]RSL33755.1 hypothetical protein D7Z54_08670 [Salibacterium salarium]
MSKDWLMHPWLEKFLPDHLRPVDDHIFSEAHGIVLIQETEAALNRLIEYGKQVKSAQTFKKNGKTFQFRLKINQKRMKLLSYETHKSEAALKKRIVIEYIRKAYAPKSKQKRYKEATVQYIKNGQTYVRGIQKSKYFNGIMEKLELLDDALLGGLIENKSTETVTSSTAQEPKEDKEFIHSSEEPFHFIQQLENKIKSDWKLDNLLENRLKQLLEETHLTGYMFDSLDIEERYTIKRMLQTDIPSLIDTYLSLSEENKKKQIEQIYEALVKMEINIRSLREKAEYAKVNKMEQLLELNQRRYRVKKNNNDPE